MKQEHAEFRLESAERLRERGLGDVKPSGGAGDAALVDHGEEVSELALIHRESQLILSNIYL
jgi:hypothetical protein